MDTNHINICFGSTSRGFYYWIEKQFYTTSNSTWVLFVCGASAHWKTTQIADFYFRTVEESILFTCIEFPKGSVENVAPAAQTNNNIKTMDDDYQNQSMGERQLYLDVIQQ